MPNRCKQLLGLRCRKREPQYEVGKRGKKVLVWGGWKGVGPNVAPCQLKPTSEWHCPQEECPYFIDKDSPIETTKVERFFQLVQSRSEEL